HRGAPSRPRPWNRIVTRCGEQVAPVEYDARVDVPGNAECRVVDDVGVPDAMKERVAVHDWRASDVGFQVLERVDRRELGHPRVAELGDVGRRLADERSEQLLMCRGPGHGLHTN